MKFFSVEFGNKVLWRQMQIHDEVSPTPRSPLHVVVAGVGVGGEKKCNFSLCRPVVAAKSRQPGSKNDHERHIKILIPSSYHGNRNGRIKATIFS